MKKLLVLLICIQLISVKFHAQTLTSGLCNPVHTDQFALYFKTNTFTVPATGTGQNWNYAYASLSFGGAQGNNFIINYTSALMPLANLKGTHSRSPYNTPEMYKTSATALELVGQVNTDGDTCYYTDTKKLMSYPFNYGDSYSDTWSFTKKAGNLTYTTNGTYSVTAEGTGTMLTAYGSSNYVLLLHSIETGITYSSQASAPTQTYMTQRYSWHFPGLHQAMVSVQSTTINGVLTPTNQILEVVTNLTTIFTGITQSNNAVKEISYYPNPANTEVYFTTEMEYKQAEVTVTDVSGKIVKQALWHEGEEAALDISALEPGLYFVSARVDGRVMNGRKLVVGR